MMFLHEETLDLITTALRMYTGHDEKLRIIKSVSGGSINSCFQLEYGRTCFFLKLNSATKYPGMLKAEAQGLKAISDTGAIKVPAVIGSVETAQEQALILEWVESGPNNLSLQESLGRSLAKLHENENTHFGYKLDNYMGSLPQKNNLSSSWADFFIGQRLKPQVKLGEQMGLISKEVLQLFDSLYQILDRLSPPEPPRLIHGDLWGGNYLINLSNEPVLIDPAIAFANREADIAMTTLFGGFQEPFYRAYNEVLALQDGWQQRLDLWNLYPLLVHLNLFGVSYLPQITTILKRYV